MDFPRYFCIESGQSDENSIYIFRQKDPTGGIAKRFASP